MFPVDFIPHLSKASGFDLESFIRAHQVPALTSIRYNPSKTEQRKDNQQPIAWCSEGFYLQQRPDFTLDPAFHAGAYYVQEASSMSISNFLTEQFGQSRNLKILDLCAAPGGKSTLLLSWLDGEGFLVANEVIKTRAAILRDSISRWGYANAAVSSNDPFQFKRLPNAFDVILVDAPCSGSGMFRKDSSAMKHWSLDAVEHCAARQNRIVEDVWTALKPNGLLIYATCSYSTAENEDITKLIADELGGSIIKSKTLSNTTHIIENEYGYRFYPNRIAGEGFYVSCIRKQADEYIPKRPSNKPKIKLQPCGSEMIDWLNNANAYFETSSHLGKTILPEVEIEWISNLFEELHLLKLGISQGDSLKGKFIPDHDLALFNQLNSDVPSINLSLAEALKYLKKESLQNPEELRGIHLVRYEGLGLGWANAVQGRLNNSLPKSWRILKDIE
jgi:16S rRNA C967 or C1407 C5-methylase (RsmB/RsmF family)/NOL1/NOP2/fmu family ribosome biogenesis protein